MAADARLRRAVAYVEQHLADNPRLDEVAAHAGLSRSKFFEMFRRELGVAPRQYADAMRMGIARRMLADSSVSIAHISDVLGFSAATHFSRFFVRHAGIRPAHYRRREAAMPGRRCD